MTTQQQTPDGTEDDGQRVGESAAPQATGEYGSILDEDLPPVVPDDEVEVEAPQQR